MSNDLSEHINFVNDLKKNIIRTMEMRLQVQQDKNEALNMLQQNPANKTALQKLEVCLKYEKNYTETVKNALIATEKEINVVKNDILNSSTDQEFKNNTKTLFKLIDLFKSNISKIENRIKKEEMILELQDEKSIKEFEANWQKELKLNKKALHKFNDAKKLSDYFEGIGAKIGISIGAGAGLTGIAALAIHGQAGSAEVPPQALVILGTVAAIAALIFQIQMKIEEMDELAFNKAKSLAR